MRERSELPDLDALPSVLETDEVDDVLAQIINAAEHNPEVSRNLAVERMVDAIFARGYRPGERFNPETSHRIFEWIQKNWEAGDVNFAGYASTVLLNLDCPGTVEFIRQLVKVEQREFVLGELQQCLTEMGYPNTADGAG